MGTIASQITNLTIVYSIVFSDADQRKYQSSAWLAFGRGIHRGPVNSPHKWPVTRKMFPFDDVTMYYVLYNSVHGTAIGKTDFEQTQGDLTGEQLCVVRRHSIARPWGPQVASFWRKHGYDISKIHCIVFYCLIWTPPSYHRANDQKFPPITFVYPYYAQTIIL